MARQGGYNPKRRIRGAPLDSELVNSLSERCVYTGSPQHKRNPGDFGLTPPSDPRPGKSLCDSANVDSHAEARRLLRSGFRDNLLSEQVRNGWPQNIWAVRETDEEVFEAQLENVEQGSYHGYPMQFDDPFRKQVLDAWRRGRS